MALAITTPSSRISNLIPGLGFGAVVQFVYDNSYPTGGEVADLSGTFPSEVYGGRVISDTLNDGGYKCSYVRAAAGAPATGVVQVYYGNNNGGADGVMVECADMTDISAMNGQLWLFLGR